MKVILVIIWAIAVDAPELEREFVVTQIEFEGDRTVGGYTFPPSVACERAMGKLERDEYARAQRAVQANYIAHMECIELP